jgi:hypothetical protein
MHAVVVNVTINDPEAAERALREQLNPESRTSPGSSPDTGRSRTTPD